MSHWSRLHNGGDHHENNNNNSNTVTVDSEWRRSRTFRMTHSKIQDAEAPISDSFVVVARDMVDTAGAVNGAWGWSRSRSQERSKMRSKLAEESSRMIPRHHARLLGRNVRIVAMLETLSKQKCVRSWKRQTFRRMVMPRKREPSTLREFEIVLTGDESFVQSLPLILSTRKLSNTLAINTLSRTQEPALALVEENFSKLWILKKNRSKNRMSHSWEWMAID